MSTYIKTSITDVERLVRNNIDHLTVPTIQFAISQFAISKRQLMISKIQFVMKEW